MSCQTGCSRSVKWFLRDFPLHAGDGGNPAEQYRLDFYVKRDSQTGSDWQDLTVNESNLHASARFLQDPRYWRPGQEVFEPTPGQEEPRVCSITLRAILCVMLEHVLGTSPANLYTAKWIRCAAMQESRYTAASAQEQNGEQPLRRLTMRLPPPPPHAASRLPAAIRRAFRRLFSALQLDDIFIEDEATAVDRTKV